MTAASGRIAGPRLPTGGHGGQCRGRERDVLDVDGDCAFVCRLNPTDLDGWIAAKLLGQRG